MTGPNTPQGDVIVHVFGRTDVGRTREHNEDTFTVADLTAAALLYPMVWPPEYQYELPDPPPSEFLRSVSGHPALDWIRATWRRFRGRSAEAP